MTPDRKKVILFKAYKPDHNSECLVCDAWVDDCECLYIISEDKLQKGDKFIFIDGENYSLRPKYGYFVCTNTEDNLFKECETFARKVIATPDQINLSKQDKEAIFTNAGKCEVEMTTCDAGEDGMNGFREPKLKNGKIIIHYDK